MLAVVRALMAGHRSFERLEEPVGHLRQRLGIGRRVCCAMEGLDSPSGVGVESCLLCRSAEMAGRFASDRAHAHGHADIEKRQPDGFE